MRTGRERRGFGPWSRLAGAVGVALLGACSTTSGAESAGLVEDRTVPPPSERPDVRAIEESDIYRLDGDWLYVLNEAAGLSILDVSDPRQPAMAGRMPIGGAPGELYVRGSAVFVLFEELETSCALDDVFDVDRPRGYSELLTIDGAPDAPAEVGRLCMPGVILASRLVGDILYVVSNEEEFGWSTSWQTWLFSYDVSDPESVTLVDFMALEGQCQEVHVTTSAIYLTQPTTFDPELGTAGTAIRYVDISDPEGAMIERGEVAVSGAPMGRFHMDEWGSDFRIVTYNSVEMSSNLHVIDVSDPDHLQVVGALEGIAPGEELHATYFVEGRAYVVTWLPPTPEFPWGWDPLWIISVEDSTSPVVMGELDLPGWSDFVFPVGDRLIGVGRGEGGDGIGMALFDISNPYEPELLRRLEFGSPVATSEANVDFRGVRIIEPGRLSDRGIVAVPFDDNYVSFHGCEEPGHFVQLVDVMPSDLDLRAAVELRAPGRRTLPIGDRLYVIDDQDVSAVDVEDTGSPVVLASVVVGDDQVLENQCLTFGGLGEAGCNVTGAALAEGREGLLALLLSSVVVVALGLRRRS